jgi:hypothetical protein
MSDETWGAICDSVKTHPTLQILDLRCTAWAPMAPAVLTYRIQALVDMLEGNLSIHTMRFPDLYYGKHELFRGSVIPYLERNRLWVRVRAIQKTRPIAYRTKVLGRALVAVRTDVNSFWTLLSGNAEVAFSSTTATSTPAVNLPILLPLLLPLLGLLLQLVPLLLILLLLLLPARSARPLLSPTRVYQITRACIIYELLDGS